jgi:hypothetical protein
MKDFGSIGEFVAYLRLIAPVAEHQVQKALHHAGRLVQEEAQDSIGVYQSSAGPFAAWKGLADTTLSGFTDKKGRYHPGKEELGFAPPDNPLMRTEQLKHAIELSVSHNHAVVGVGDEQVGDGSPEDPFRNLGDVAVWIEFGTEDMEARSFLGRALFVKEKAVASIIGHATAAALAGEEYSPKPEEKPHTDIPF